MEPIPGYHFDPVKKKYFKDTPEAVAKRRKEALFQDSNEEPPQSLANNSSQIMHSLTRLQLGSPRSSFTLQDPVLKALRRSKKEPQTRYSSVTPTVSLEIHRNVAIVVTADTISKLAISSRSLPKSQELLYTGHETKWLHSTIHGNQLVVAAICQDNIVKIFSCSIDLSPSSDSPAEDSSNYPHSALQEEQFADNPAGITDNLDVFVKVSSSIKIYSSCFFDCSLKCILGGAGRVVVLDWRTTGHDQRPEPRTADSFSSGGIQQSIPRDTESREPTATHRKSRFITIFGINSRTDIQSVKAQSESLIYAGGRDGDVYLIDTRAGHRSNGQAFLRCRMRSSACSLNCGTPVTCLDSDSSFRVYSGHLNGDVNQWDTRFTRSPVNTFYNLNSIKPFKFEIINEKYLVSASDLGQVKSWSLNNGELIKSMKWGNLTEEIRPIVAWSTEEQGLWIVDSNGFDISRWGI